MALDYHSLKTHVFTPERQAYGEDDCILYALGVGAGLSEDDAVGDEIQFIYERGLRALPAMACVLAYPGFWMRDPRHCLDWTRVIHGEQRMRFAHRLPTSTEVVCEMEVSRIADKGPGAFVVTRRTLTDAATGQELALIEQLNICRGDGGYSRGDAALSDALAAPIPAPPASLPDIVIILPTSRNQGALYRLNADRNPLHVDPDSARRAGYERPILHGAALLGMVNRALEAVLRRLPGLRLGELDMRFMAPAYPGLDVSISLWHQPQGIALACHQAGALCAQGRAAWTEEQQ
ncbi:3-alpha,7-alpha,12-alpha-trihydroxy-5-beta-cholest-24-enoyl-CoA hydratase [Bordetella genomosp. 1]|uniref:3-alpha,7-alpha, 12-alpha-trihydroxy-5-beta-cholest-24-enoyl-CoA hydratase n=1 Tax=Bordetella genomosp. 1 TaxID=1395607 RepID=A0A261S719_9BORD|nr:MaoC/PaaZ C-terminal domain-containing protein [Bordetella genomosp. 1]OZI33168.1 3-alpha,7-alpha,12-alpha-trihydroxy-5-beta-cholest-24-enoyl-CoA hydratase [Bordetella genomosp. 1]